MKLTLTPRSRRKGFTLIELMIVAAIVAILAAIAYPSYRSYIVKTRKSEAQAALIQWAQGMERYYSTNGMYTTSITSNTCATVAGAPTTNSFYSYSPACPVPTTSSTFTLTATPVSGSIMSNESNLTLTNTGQKSTNWTSSN